MDPPTINTRDGEAAKLAWAVREQMDEPLSHPPRPPTPTSNALRRICDGKD